LIVCDVLARDGELVDDSEVGRLVADFDASEERVEVVLRRGFGVAERIVRMSGLARPCGTGMLYASDGKSRMSIEAIESSTETTAGMSGEITGSMWE
jgi:hypothetical protein